MILDPVTGIGLEEWWQDPSHMPKFPLPHEEYLILLVLLDTRFEHEGCFGDKRLQVGRFRTDSRVIGNMSGRHIPPIVAWQYVPWFFKLSIA
jgi:hypothetical protein